MKQGKTLIQTILLLLISNFAIAQAPIYLQIGDCTKEMHYTYTNSSNYFGEYFDYHFALNDYETVVFEVPKSGWKNISYNLLSQSQIIHCGTANFDQKINYEAIENMQNHSQIVYLLKQTATGYKIAEAEKTKYQFYLKEDGFLRVIAEDVSFDYNEGNTYDAGEELIQGGEGSFIYYTQQYERCYKKPIFMHVPTNFMEAATLEYALGVGLVRAYSDDMEKKLIAVNGQNINYYLDAFCGIEEPLIVDNESSEPINTVDEIVTEYDHSIYIDKEAAIYFEKDQTYNTKGIEEVSLPQDLMTTAILPELATAAKQAESTTKMNTAKAATMAQMGMLQYVVKQGDTLYSISKEYNLTTLQIKKLNNLKSNTIEIDQVLFLK